MYIFPLANYIFFLELFYFPLRLFPPCLFSHIYTFPVPTYYFLFIYFTPYIQSAKKVLTTLKHFCHSCMTLPSHSFSSLFLSFSLILTQSLHIMFAPLTPHADPPHRFITFPSHSFTPLFPFLSLHRPSLTSLRPSSLCLHPQRLTLTLLTAS